MITLVALVTTSKPLVGQDIQVGQTVTNEVEHGRFIEYVPKSVNKKSMLLVVCHGMFSPADNAESAARGTIKHWTKFAEENKVIVVAPAFDNENYGCTTRGAMGGYRTLTGRQVGADEFVHEIIARFEKMNDVYDGRFLLFGHSAGAQFSNRYVVRHPQRVIGALISSPAWFAFPDPARHWPEGMGPRKKEYKWGSDRIIVDVTPDPATWLAATQVPIKVIVGELDNEELKDTGMTHVTQAKAWVKQMEKHAAENDQESLVEVEVVKGVGHNLGKLTRAGMPFLVKAIQHDKRVQAEKKK